MNNLRKINFHNQKGQATIFIVALLLIAGALAFLSIPKNLEPQRQQICANIDTAKKVQFKGRWYDQIRGISPLSTEQFKYHIATENDKVDGRTVYTPKTNCQLVDEARNGIPGMPGEVKGAILDPNSGYVKRCEEDRPRGAEHYRSASSSYGGIESKDMLFVEGNVEYNQPGFTFTEVYISEDYLKASSNKLPDFIQTYCNQQQPVEQKVIFPDKDGNIYPPAYIETSKMHLIKPTSFKAGVYTIFAYERRDSIWGDAHSGSLLNSDPAQRDPDGIGTYEIGEGNNKRVYTAHIASYAQYISLVDKADSTYVYLYSYQIPTPTPVPTGSVNKSLQIQKFDAFILQPWGWWSPECKPAIYLYPQEKTSVHVQVDPKGFLTYTNPLYPSSGWEVIAYPNGKISTDNKDYEYLYYESKIHDNQIEKPTEEYVTRYEDLPQLYSTLLPQLGLSSKETQDFKGYWEKYLPKSSYYFVGIMTDMAIERIEPLTISPKPDTIIRVRLYFEALNEKKTVQAPTLKTPTRNGFSVVEWGGLVKVDKDHPFTCSQ